MAGSSTQHPSSDEALDIISKAWGRQRGYVFFPYIDREEQVRTGQRRAGYHEAKPFRWPRDRDKIVEHMDAHRGVDLYWCPSIFEYPERKVEFAMDEHALWADLDEADPRKIDSDYMPSTAWETSPGRYQALWIISNGDMLGASWPGNENQRLSYYIGADKSGWDTTQLLRIPGWVNHKPEYAEAGDPPTGKLLWKMRGRYQPNDFEDLPEVEGALRADQITDALQTEIEKIDRHRIISRVKLRLNQRARDLLYARSAIGPQGTRGDNLWYLIRCLADAGCTVTEIVAVTRETVWNKFEGRADEVKRLLTEATKAVAQRDPGLSEKIEEDRAPKPRPSRLAAFLQDVKPPKWLVKGVATQGSVGFIAGSPKSFKSWFALDLALSVSTGARFLDHFDIIQPGPVLYIQEEDSPITVKARSKKIWKGKAIDKMRLHTDGSVVWEPGNADEFDPDIDIYCMEGFTVSEEHWQEWLDATLAEGMLCADGQTKPYVLVIVDTLMNVAGDVEENKSQQMTTKIYKPIKLLMRKHECAFRFVHHMGKGPADDSRRGGQKMLGGTANHAWSEDSLYLTRHRDGVKMELESKSAPEKTYRISNLDNFEWQPLFEPENKTEPVATAKAKRSSTPKASASQPILDLLGQGGQWACGDLAKELSEGYHPIYHKLKALEAKGQARRLPNKRWQAV